MMKSLFCILSLAFLLLGIGHVSNQDLQGFRENAGISASCISLAVLSPADSDSSLLCESSLDDNLSTARAFFSTSSTNYTYCILSALSVPGTSIPVKTLRFNSISTIVQLLSSQDSRLPENRWKNLFSDTNHLKYSNRQYLYSLAHILI